MEKTTVDDWSCFSTTTSTKPQRELYSFIYKVGRPLKANITIDFAKIRKENFYREINRRLANAR